MCPPTSLHWCKQCTAGCSLILHWFVLHRTFPLQCKGWLYALRHCGNMHQSFSGKSLSSDFFPLLCMMMKMITGVIKSQHHIHPHLSPPSPPPPPLVLNPCSLNPRRWISGLPYLLNLTLDLSSARRSRLPQNALFKLESWSREGR